MSRNHPPIYFLRHGETDWNKGWRYQGQRDIPLNDTGRAQARRNGARLVELMRSEGLEPADLAYVASPLKRARETMEIARAALGLEAGGYATDERLMEIHYGAWEGMTRSEVKAARRGEWRARRETPFEFAAPGGESYRQLAGRVGPWLETLDGPSIVVAHGGVMRALRHLLCGLDPAQTMASTVPQDKVLVISANRSRFA
ncbi:MAG: histidine phosphatase family protein [Flavobacteriaceae bacterium]